MISHFLYFGTYAICFEQNQCAGLPKSFNRQIIDLLQKHQNNQKSRTHTHTHTPTHLQGVWFLATMLKLCMSTWCQKLSQPEALPPKATAEKQTISGHFSLLMLDKPSEGLPVLTDWLRTAGDVWTVGYEAWRSPIEVCPMTDDVLGQAMEPCTLVPVKGVGRASIILFAVCYSYMNLRDMGPEELEDFSRTGISQKDYKFQMYQMGSNG